MQLYCSPSCQDIILYSRNNYPFNFKSYLSWWHVDQNRFYQISSQQLGRFDIECFNTSSFSNWIDLVLDNRNLMIIWCARIGKLNVKLFFPNIHNINYTACMACMGEALTIFIADYLLLISLRYTVASSLLHTCLNGCALYIWNW